MSLPASDAFNRADGALGANWTSAFNTLSIYSHQVQSDSALVRTEAFWNADVFADDQFSKAVLSLNDNQNIIGIGVSVRADDVGGGNGYVFYALSNGFYQWGKVVAGVFIFVNQAAQTPVQGDIIEIHASGTTISMLVNSTEVGSYTDSDLTSGSAGLSGYNQGTDILINAWSGGNLPVPDSDQRITQTSSSVVGVPFDIRIVLVDSLGDTAVATADTHFSISVTSGTGSLSGTTTGTITAGNSFTAITGLIYSVSESGVILTSARTSGDVVADGTLTVNVGSGTAVTDNFDRASLGANWTLGSGTIDISSDQVGSDTAGVNRTLAFYNAAAFADDQFASLRISAAATTGSCGIGVCVRGSVDNGYIFYEASIGVLQWGKIVGGVFTIFDQLFHVPRVGDVLQLSATGHTIVGLLNGHEIFSEADYSLTSGSAGLSGYSQGTEMLGDSWVGGSEPIAATAQSVSLVGAATVGYAFSIEVVLEDDYGDTATALLDTDVSLSVTTGTGVLSGTTTGTISSGDSSVTITGVIYSVVENDVVLTSHRTSGDVISDETVTLNVGQIAVTRVTDNFDRPDGDLGGYWSQVYSSNVETTSGGGGGIQIKNHNYTPINSDAWDGFAIWNGVENFRSDQFAQCTLKVAPSFHSTVNITAASQSGATTTYTYTLSTGAALINPQSMYISGMADSGNNGYFLITGLGSGTFSVSNASGVTRAGQSGTGVSPSDSNIGLCVRVDPVNMNGYFFIIGSNSYSSNPNVPDGRIWDVETWKMVNGRGQFMGSRDEPWLTAAVSVNDVLTFAAVGNEVSALKNGVLMQSYYDSDPISGGKPGIWTWSLSGPNEYLWGSWPDPTVMVDTPGDNQTQASNWVGSDYPIPETVHSEIKLQVATDNFNRANGNLGVGNWTDIYGVASNFKISSNQIYPNQSSATIGAAFWNADAFASNQYASVTITSTAGGNNSIGPAVRCTTTDGGNGYMCMAYGNSVYIVYKVVQGIQIALNGIFQVPQVGDVIEIQAIGSVIISKVNGIVIDSRVDADLTIGSAGVGGYDANTLQLVDSWEGGNLLGFQKNTVFIL